MRKKASEKENEREENEWDSRPYFQSSKIRERERRIPVQVYLRMGGMKEKRESRFLLEHSWYYEWDGCVFEWMLVTAGKEEKNTSDGILDK